MGKFYKYPIVISDIPFRKKPETESEKRWMFSLIGKSRSRKASLKVIGYLASNYYAFCPCDFKYQHVLITNFISSGILVVDIDHGISPQEALDRCDELDLAPPFLIYPTLSDKTDKKLSKEEKLKTVSRFRMMFALDTIIDNFTEYEKLVKNGIQALFPEADRIGATQKFFGSNELIYENYDSLLNPAHLMCIADIHGVKHIKTPQARQKTFKEKYKDLSLLKPIIPKVSATGNGQYEDSGKFAHIRNFDWDQAMTVFPLLNDFLNKHRKIRNPELLGLLSGMIRIQGGVKLWKKCIKENPLINDRHLIIYDWYISQWEQDKNPWELPITFYAPDDPAAQHYENLTEIHFKRGSKAYKLKDACEIPLNEAEVKLNAFVKKAIEDQQNKKWILKAATSIGKSKSIIENVKSGCIIAVPTHKLKLELSERMKAEGVSHNVIPEEPDLDERLQYEVDTFRSVGDQIGANMFLKRMSSPLASSQYGLTMEESIEQSKILRTYFDKVDSCINSDLPLLVTHKRLFFTDFPNHDTIIIDEDIIPAMFDFGQFTTKDLRLLIEKIGQFNYEGVKKDLKVLNGILADIQKKSQFSRKIHKSPSKRSEHFEKFKLIVRAAADISHKLEGKILPFFECEYYKVDFADEDDPQGELVVHYVNNHKDKLPFDKKIVVMSATANKELYEKIFGEIEWEEVSHVQHVGKRIQISNLSWSRSSMSSNYHSGNLDEIRKFIGKIPVITFMKYRYLFPDNPTQIYIENSSGYDTLKGQDVAVVGTPHIPVVNYQLMATVLGIEFSSEDCGMEQHWVEYNGYKFQIMTFKHLGLRAIQFYHIESGLVQACGRNRSLREDATVYLFSNFPLQGYEQYSTDEIFKTVSTTLSPEESFIIKYEYDVIQNNFQHNQGETMKIDEDSLLKFIYMMNNLFSSNNNSISLN